ncbi:MAG: dipeptidase, partial [Acidothermus cellulolyticus]|nr:dipeptidase [Acidothermus cellulolyticus]
MRDRIRRLLEAAPVVDGHNDLLWELRQRFGPARRAGQPSGSVDFDAVDVAADLSATGLHTDIPRLRAGGVGAQFWSVYVPPTIGNPVTATLEQIDAARALVARYPSDLALATTADEVEAARAAGRIACLIGIEGGHSIDSSLGALRMMYALGARYLTLTHFRNT